MAAGIVRLTHAYERWLASQTKLVRADLDHKHRAMACDDFSFLRATFYRWMEQWPKRCAVLATAPRVLAVGDLHAANFGTWRDTDDRLIWGVNDFDEAYPLPYTIDLARLATSIVLAIRLGRMPLNAAAACRAILRGYVAHLKTGGEPFVLAERNQWLRELVVFKWRDDAAAFWSKADALKQIAPGAIDSAARRVLVDAMGAGGRRLDVRFARRRGGLGSLGRGRFVAIAEWRGGRIGREAKAMVPSAAAWIGGARRLHVASLLNTPLRSADPFLSLRAGWLCRQFGPDTGRVDLGAVATRADGRRLLAAMGAETANVHLGTRAAAKTIRKHLARLPDEWLLAAAKTMARQIEEDRAAWRKQVR